MAKNHCTECSASIGGRRTWRGRPISGLCKKCRDSKTGEIYYSTPIGKAHRAWNNLLKRVRTQDSYAEVKIKISKGRFIQWFLGELERWEKDHPDEKPSVDRIKNDEHYELNNLQLLEVQQNRAKNGYIKNAYGKAPRGKKWCPGCKAYVSCDEFYWSAGTSKLSHRCKECICEGRRVQTLESLP